MDYDFYGHQLVIHLNPQLGSEGKVPTYCNPVDARAVPVPHFGVVLRLPDWKHLAEKASSIVERFVIEPYVRFEGEPGEQCTMFFEDPSGNNLEFKAFADIERGLFAK